MDIETPRLLLVETYRVVSEHVNWLNDKELMRFSEQQFREHDYASQHDFLGKAMEAGSPMVWDINLKTADKNLLSVGSFHAHVDRRHMRADLGIMVGPQYHNQGYGSEAWGHVSHYLFYKEGFVKLEAGFVRDNVAMQSVLLKDNWQCEGTRYNHFIYDGRRHDVLLYGKTRS